jgi:hypothetical protein
VNTAGLWDVKVTVRYVSADVSRDAPTFFFWAEHAARLKTIKAVYSSTPKIQAAAFYQASRHAYQTILCNMPGNTNASHP